MPNSEMKPMIAGMLITPPVTHTANQWDAPDEYRHIRSNKVYQMDYSISENTRYDIAAQKSDPYSMR